MSLAQSPSVSVPAGGEPTTGVNTGTMSATSYLSNPLATGSTSVSPIISLTHWTPSVVPHNGMWSVYPPTDTPIYYLHVLKAQSMSTYI